MKDLLDALLPFLSEYRSQNWIELGCSPGHVSYLLAHRIPFVPFGVDFSPQAHLYIEMMGRHAGVQPTLFQEDFRDFTPPQPFDVVMSFGLMEHFDDPHEILDHHVRLCRKGGLIMVAIPHFRQLQWLYHALFDRTDLKKHNLSIMNLDTFRTFSQNRNVDVRFLGFVGRMSFWNVDETGPPAVAAIRKALSLLTRAVVNGLFSVLLPPNKKLYAPWIIFVAKKI